MISDRLNPLADAVERFANLRNIESTTQVEQIFEAALKQAGRPDAQLMALPADDADAYRKDQRLVREWLSRLARLKPQRPREWDAKAQELRADLAPTLARLNFIATIEFNTRGDALRVVPVRFGVESACYLVIAAMLEKGKKGPSIRAHRCPDCQNFAIAHGNVKGPKRYHCPKHSQQRGKRKVTTRGVEP
jgi:hypothetical protein